MENIDYILELDSELTFFNDEFSRLSHHGFSEYRNCKKSNTPLFERVETKIRKTISWIKRHKCLPNRYSADLNEKQYFSVITAAQSKKNNYSKKHPELQRDLIEIIIRYKSH